MKNYNDFLNEMALSKKDLIRFDRIKHTKDKKEFLKLANLEIETLRKYIKDIEYNDLTFDKLNHYDKDSYALRFDDKTDNYIFSLDKLLKKCMEMEGITDKLENITSLNREFSIEIEKNNFNRIHIISELPHYLKNIGLGKKIYLKSIDYFGYISTLLVDHSFESGMVWDSLINSDDVYTVTKDNASIICFSKKLDVDFIIDLVKKYLIDSTEYAIDKKLKKYFK